MCGHKSSVIKLKNTEIISDIFSNHMLWNQNSTTKTTKKAAKTHGDKTVCYNQWVTEEIKEEIKQIPQDK